MKIRKVRTRDGAIRWEVYGWISGRGSKQIKRRFEKKIDAENFKTDQDLEAKENANKPRTLFAMSERTFQEESAYWLAERGVSFSPGHLKRASDSLRLHILPRFGRMTLDQITPTLLSQFRLERLRTGLKPGSVNRETEVVTAILNYSVRQRRIPYNPCAGFRKLVEVREGVQFWEQAEAAEFLAFTDRKYPLGSEKRWIYVVYLLALNTALRAGEIWGLQPRDLVQGEELLHIQRQFNLVKKDFGPPKGKKARYVPCHSVLRAELKGLVSRFGLREDQTFFQNETGRPIDHDNFSKRIFEKDVAESGLKRIRFHDLRHTGTTLMIAAGLDIKTVQEICGHKDITTTMRYVHLLGDSIRQVARSYAVVPSSETKRQLTVVN